MVLDPISIGIPAAIIAPIYVHHSMNLWRLIKHWWRYFRSVVRMFSERENPKMFMALVMKISQYCTNEQYKAHRTFTFTRGTETVDEMFVMPKPGSYLKILV